MFNGGWNKRQKEERSRVVFNTFFTFKRTVLLRLSLSSTALSLKLAAEGLES